MKAIVLKKSGKPDIMKSEWVADPQPAAGEVLVKLHYTGVNYAEILSRKGLYGWAVKRPYILGMEGAGVIEAVGKGVDASRVGQKVMVGTQYGCYAEKIAVPQARAIPAVPGYSMAENAAFAVNYLTAWVSLFPMARLQQHEKLLITAAAGGVGSAAVQIASKFGVDVYGMAGSEKKISFLLSIGAKDAVNYREADYTKSLEALSGGVDVVLEMVGGEIYKNAFDLLNPFGRMVVAGFASLDLKKWNPLSWWKTWQDIPRADIREMAPKSIGVMATHIGYLLDQPEKLMQIFNELTDFVVEKDIRPIISKTFPFDAAAEAHRFIESRQSVGKVLLQHVAEEGL